MPQTWTTPNASSSASNSSGSMPEAPSPSSPERPLPPEAAGWLREAQAAAALSLRREALSALETVFRAERDLHLRLAAFSVDERERNMHLGIFHWLEEWLAGGILDRMVERAKQELALRDPDRDALEGSPYMESDVEGSGAPPRA